jgi:putative heme-binding domain-containing protein
MKLKWDRAGHSEWQVMNELSDRNNQPPDPQGKSMTRNCATVALILASFTLVGSLSRSQDKEPLPPLLVARTDPKTPEEEKKLFKLPPGFEAQLVACEPEINKPMNLNFDDRGRLWVTTSVEYPFPVPLDKPGRDRVVILEDFDENGRARKATNFAEGLNLPMGVLPLPTGWRAGGVSPPSTPGRDPEKTRGANAPRSPTSAFVYNTPNLYRMSDTDGDGKADKREVLFGPFGYRDVHGNVNGLTWGFDGWVYACHGFANDSEIRGTDGNVVKMNSGNTFRFKPDGSRVEHWTFGQVNPFGMCFDPLGNLYTADCHSRPVTMLLRGGYYQSFGKPHDGLGFAPEICGHDHGSTGLCGIVYYAADHFPKQYHDTIFVGNCVTSRICHDKLEWTGSTPKCILQPDFLVSDDPWFRPVDIKLGPDGALYVADFYNRIIGHYEVPLTHPGRDRKRGRIWRIVYKGTDGKAKPAMAPRKDWSTAKTEELIEDLGHANLTVRMLAGNQLVVRDKPEVFLALKQAIERKEHSARKAHALWALLRRQTLIVDYLRRAAHHDDRIVRVHAMRQLMASELQDTPAVIGRRTDDADATVRRAGAEGLGEQKTPTSFLALISLWQQTKPEDAQLAHTVRIALRDRLRADQDGALFSLVKGSTDKEAMIANVALAVPTAKAADFLVDYMKSTTQTPDTQVRHAVRYGSDKSREDLLNLLKSSQQPALVKAFHQGCQERGSGWNDDCQNWAKGVVKQLLATEKPEQITAAAELCGLLKLGEYAEPLAAFARKVVYPDNLRIAACNALTAIDAKANIPLLGGILTAGDEQFALHDRCAQLLAGANLPEARAELARALTSAPARLQNVIALHLAANPEGVEKLLQTIAAGKASPRLLQERGVQQRVMASRLPKVRERVEELTRNLAPVEQRLAELFKKRKDGYSNAKPQAALGAKVYEKNCANCHQLSGKGAKVGPQLDGIGVRGVDRLLEDMLDPSRNVDQAMRSHTILLKNGQLLTGLPLREEGQIIVLADAQGKEIRIAKGEIEQQKISPLSPMPANLIDQIPEEEFFHLIAYLLEQRGK